METELVATELVHTKFACPHCGEQRVDWLIWDVDGEEVECGICGLTYVPGQGEST